MTSQTRAGAIAFLAAFVTLFTQVLVHRVISAKLLNNYAFVVISLTMLGFAAAGVLLARWLERALAQLRDVISGGAATFVLTLLASTAAFYHARITQMPPSRSEFVGSFLGTVPYALLFAIPFGACGFVLGALLSSRDLATSRVYFSDLVGSALGAIAVVPAISALGAEGGLLLACAIMLVGCAALAWPRSAGVKALLGAALIALVGCAVARDRVFDIGGWARNSPDGMGIETVVWDPVARVEVSRIAPPDPKVVSYPSLIGDDPRLLARLRRSITQNGYAFTLAADYDGRRESLAGLDRTIYAAAYEAGTVEHPNVVILGVGGGFDVLNAIDHDASRITGVEINAATVSVLRNRYKDYFQAWVDDPRFTLVNGEGRHFLATHADTWDVIQLSGVDSYSGTLAAAHVFSESYLYTAEAFDLYLSRLGPQGILNLMRLEHRPPREMLRALITAIGALRRAGVAEPAQHIVTITATPAPNFTALLVKKTPFKPEEVARLRAWADRSPYFDVSAAPDASGPPANEYQLFLSLRDPRRERAFVARYPWDISPALDDRPFFFRQSYWWHLFTSDPLITRTSVPAMEITVLILLAITGLAALITVYLPLRLLTGRGRALPSSLRYGGFFAGVGLGYLAIEVALLQRFGLFLGHPNYALSVVLAALLFSSGVGALWSRRVVARLGGELRFASYAVAGVVLAEVLVFLPWLPHLIGWPFAARVALVALLVAPAGLLMGAFVPTGLDRLKQVSPSHVPWAWGVNGIFSVIAPILAIAFSMTWGMEALLIAAVPVYLLSGWALPPAPAARGAVGAVEAAAVPLSA